MIYVIKNLKTTDTLAVDTLYLDEEVLEDWLFPCDSAPADVEEIMDALTNTLHLRENPAELEEEFGLTITPYTR